MKRKEGKVEIYKDRKGEWRWRIIASNGRKLANSGEGYKRKRDCTRSLNFVLTKVWWWVA